MRFRNRQVVNRTICRFFADRNNVEMCSDSEMNMSAYAEQSHAPSLTSFNLKSSQ